VSPVVWLGVLLAGGAGAVLRFLLDGALSRRASGAFPLGTFTVNVTGALLLGLLTGLVLGDEAALLAGTAAVGSFTTFSTWLLETQRLSEEWAVRTAGVNVVASLVVGVAAAGMGVWLGTLA
jgi:CrcB protein